MIKNWVCFALLAATASGQLHAGRLKELVAVEGVRENQLVGYGLVVGLNGTGDKRQTRFAAQSLASLLQQMGVTVPGTALDVKNTAGVMITATLPAYAQPGSRLDTTVSAIGDATNLQGGILILSGLKGVDGQTYVMAQGPVVTGGFVAGRGGNSSTLNHPTVGRIPNGGIIERAGPDPVLGGVINLNLHRGDFTTASRIAEAINKQFPDVQPLARAKNSSRVQVSLPSAYAERAPDFIAKMEAITVDADRVVKVVINERTGTVTLGRDVVISPVSILHGGLSVEVQTTFDVSQPAPFSQGTTTTVPKVDVAVKEEQAKNLLLKPGATVEDLVRALTAVGSTSRDVIAILQNLKAAGALDAEIEVI